VRPAEGATMMTLTRAELIDRLRAKLLEHCDEEHSICETASEQGIFCRGFSQWKFTELRKRYPTIVRSRPAITPAELLDLANRWQLARQVATEQPIACDVQLHEGERCTCHGWDEWSSEDLLRFYGELGDEDVTIEG
jgi:hypothetical protein